MSITPMVARTSICFQVEVSDLSTVVDQVADVIESIGLDHGGEGSQFSLSTRMPDHTLDETLATGDGEEVNLSGRGLELYGVFP